MTIESVIFDWGGTLTPWHDIDQREILRRVAAAHLDATRVEEVADALLAAEREVWRRCEEEHRSATFADVFALAGVEPSDALLAAWFEAWMPHTFTRPDVPDLLRRLREGGTKVGVLSNTYWSRAWHERIFARDGILDLIDGAVYTSEIPWTKPHPEAFRAVMAAVGVEDPRACVFVGDRPYDDVHGAKTVGMRAVLLPNSNVPGYDGAEPDAVIDRLADLLPLISDSDRGG
ncbi:MAG: HAD-IA family hydrolase [Streptosporangiales bacterium]|nr:HAD-IA family hydrolase [Streptosporangiales bacterium]